MSKKIKIIAKHKILNFIDCKITAVAKEQFEEIVRSTGANIIKTVEHHFSPQGLTLLTLLSESHASLHTYPEHKFCYLDIFTCGDMNISAFERGMREILKPQRIISKTINRSY